MFCLSFHLIRPPAKSTSPTGHHTDSSQPDLERLLCGNEAQSAADNDGYEPTLAVAIKNFGDGVEIRIRDNGTGNPPDVKEKMCNPFFTTKPAGEGTGLGLSISHDIVKKHSGSIEVDTNPGEFTEIRIILPRVAGSSPNLGDELDPHRPECLLMAAQSRHPSGVGQCPLSR